MLGVHARYHAVCPHLCVSRCNAGVSSSMSQAVSLTRRSSAEPFTLFPTISERRSRGAAAALTRSASAAGMKLWMMIMRGARETISSLNRGIMLAVFYDDYARRQGDNLQPEEGYYAGCLL